MLVFAEIVSRDVALDAASGDDGDFALEINKTFEDHRAAAERPVDGRDVGALAQHRLTLAVIAEAPGFEDRGAAELGHRAHQRTRILDRMKWRRLEPEAAQELLFDEPVLRLRQGAGAGPHRLALAQIFDRRGRHVLELIGDDVDALGEG